MNSTRQSVPVYKPQYLPNPEQAEDFDDLQEAYSTLFSSIEERLIVESPTEFIGLLQALMFRCITGWAGPDAPNLSEVERLMRLISFLSRLHEDYHNVDYFRALLRNAGYKLPKDV